MNKIIKIIVTSFVLILLSITPVFALENQPHHWSYGGAENPTNWGNLDENYVLCRTGRDQSPINLNPDDHLNNINGLTTLNFNYKETPLTIINNGHTIQVNNNNSDSYLKLNGQKYQLLQFHFHTPSEHTLEDIASAMELHFVHQKETGELAVVGVMIKEGESNPILANIWQNIPSEIGTNQVDNFNFNPNKLLPKNNQFYHYQGSLTTPPCSEGVQWNIMLKPIEASAQQIEDFMNLYQVNARPIQALNGRKIDLNL